MKKLLLFLVSVHAFVSCEDKYESIYSQKYSTPYTTTINYPIYYDASDILVDVQVTPPVTLVSPYKIASNDKYLFIGEMMKGFHVYEKTGEHSVLPLCFIECKLSKAFDVIDEYLFCNNFADLLVIDVSNPQQASVKRRQKNHFNRYDSYVTYWNVPYTEGKGFVVDYHPVTVTAIVTDTQPEPDFSEYDKLYDNIIIKEMPLSLISGDPEASKPYVGIAKNEKEIYTFGKYNSWAVCTYQTSFHITEQDLWHTPQPIYPTPYYYSNAYPYKLFNKDGFMNIIGSGYVDCGKYNTYPSAYHHYFPDESQIDVTYMDTQDCFFILAKNRIRKTFYDDEYYEHYIEYAITHGAVTITCVQDNIITLGDKLLVYDFPDETLPVVKEYPDISGICMVKHNDVLTIVNTQGVFFYDISNVNDIKLIQ